LCLEKGCAQSGHHHHHHHHRFITAAQVRGALTSTTPLVGRFRHVVEAFPSSSPPIIEPFTLTIHVLSQYSANAGSAVAWAPSKITAQVRRVRK
jgi:hypothetical protein